MGIEILVMWIVIASAGAFGVNKAVDLWKHGSALDADRYAQCVKHAETVRDCRTLE
jgi:hypothetical protein